MNIRPKHPVIAIIALFCVALTCLDWLTYTHLSLMDTLVSALFLALTVCVPFAPVPVGCTLAGLSFLHFLLPYAVQGPNILWSTWLALLVLGYFLNYRLSAPIIVVVAASPLIGDHLYAGFSGDDITRCGSLIVAGIAGCFTQYYLSYRRLLEENRNAELLRRKQEERLLLARDLHDDIAGSISYALALCRTADDPNDFDQSQHIVQEISRTLTASLAQLRTAIIPPLIQCDDAMQTHCDGSQSEIKRGYAGLCQQMLSLDRRLSRAAFDGTIRCTVDLDDDTADCVNRILTELCNNIVKHGRQSYLIIICTAGESVQILSSNVISEPSNATHPGNGLRLLTADVESIGGTVQTHIDDGEWTTRVTLPVTPTSCSD